MKKKLFGAIMAIAMSLSLVSMAASAAGGEAAVSVSDATVGLCGDQTFSVSVSLDTNPGIMAAEFELDYDAELVTLVSSEEGSAIDMMSGGKHPVFMNMGGDVTTTGTLITYNFQLNDGWEAGDTSKITVKQCVFGNKASEELTVKVTSGTVTAKDNHNAQTVPGTPATCTAPGLSDGKKCSTCGEVLAEQTVIDILPHDQKVNVPGTPATCTATGLSDGKKCSGCGIVTVEQTVLAIVDHTPAVDKAVEATCTATGLTEGSHCSVCQKVLVAQEVVPMTAHPEETINEVKATCTKTGLTAGTKCSVCDKILKAQETVPALGHTEVVVPGKAASCTATGLTDGKQCSVCGVTTLAQETIAILPHTEEIIPAEAPTCTETGLTEGKKCSVCNKVLLAQEIVPIHPDNNNDNKCDICGTVLCEHKTTAVIPAVAPTCTETGLTAGEECTVCETITKVQEIVPALGHTEVVDAYKAPTCTETGLTEGKHCSVCDDTIIAQTEIPATGHAFSQTATKIDSKYHGFQCTNADCGVFDEATKAEHEFDGRTCTVCAYTKPAPRPDKDDEEDEPVVVQPAAMNFTDVSEKNWFYKFVKFAYDEGLMAGISATEFGPKMNTTRAMIVTILWKMEGSPVVKGGSDFADVAAKDYFYNAVAWAAENDIVSGYGNGYFGSKDIITREQMATILYNYAEFKGMNTTTTKDNLKNFNDYAKVSAYAVKPMNWAVENGLISGDTANNLMPKDGAQRCQVAAILYNFDQLKK